MSNTRIELLIIDPQKCFCDVPPVQETIENKGIGSLYVPGAAEDMERASDFITRNSSKFDDIHVTIDAHHRHSIFHPNWWRNPNNGDRPGVFTQITHKDVLDGKWVSSIPSLQKWSLEYTAQLEKTNRYQLTIWPIHAEIGTPGMDINAKIKEALSKWEDNNAVVDYVTKGSNIYTENYSVFKAEVPRADDASTQLNTRLINTLQQADIIPVLGEGLSHCVLSSLRDLVEAFGDDKYLQKIVLLTDCSSIIPGFEKQTQDFLKEMTSRGMQLSTTDKFLK